MAPLSGGAGPGAGGPVRPPGPLLEAVVRAAALPGVGGARLRDALCHRDGARAGLERLAWRHRSGLTAAARDRAEGWARRALDTVREEGIHVLLPGEEGYPAALLPMHDPPCPLFARGRLELLAGPMVAVVGTRRATPYGREAARRMAAGVAAAGVPVISGMATGIDGEAHRAAGPGRTVAVLGSGIDVVYPRSHQALYGRIVREGLVLSELLPGTPPAKHQFPARNRIIAGLSKGVVVVEAPPGSGALITARQAVELGRYAFVVPGPIRERGFAGSNDFIREGATLVTTAREVLEALELPLPPADFEAELPPRELEGQGLALWRYLSLEPRHVDEISGAVGLPARRALASLLALEVQGHARQLPGLRFIRT